MAGILEAKVCNGGVNMAPKPVSLWDLMQLFLVSKFLKVFSILGGLEAHANDEGRQFTQSLRDSFIVIINQGAIESCSELRLTESLSAFERFRETIQKQNVTLSEIKWKCRALRELVENEADKRLTFVVQHELNKYYNNEALFGEKVKEAFPSSRQDLKDAGNCIAFGNNTAGVFHLMRVTEWGLRAFALHLKIKDIKVSGKAGKEKYIPIAYAEWGKILDTAQKKIDSFKQLARGRKKQISQRFYSPLVMDLRALHEAYRNYCMHTLDSYTHEEVLAIFSRVERVMVSLASEGIREV